MANVSGIVYYSEGLLTRLPLEELRVKALIIDVSARVSVTQIFTNSSESATSHAKYVFPVPARAAVCAFEMRSADGRVVVGVAKEKTQAKQEYEAAIHQGKFAGLVEWVLDDVFTISVGSIPSKQKVTVKLVYVMDLMEENIVDHIRFQIPMSLGERYGTEPVALLTAERPSSQTSIRITTDIQTNEPIQSVSSPTHTSDITISPYITHLGKPSRRRATAKFRSHTFLKSDFVLIVHADGLDAPRCFAEFDESKPGTVALQLTLVPKFKLPPIPSQEYIFLVDRSGSMGGSRIETAKRTLIMLLHMLPNSGTIFNVFGFGSSTSHMQSRSVSYAEASLTAATSYTKAMEADLGGTEIRAALQTVFQSRDMSRPTIVFVLTDGEVYNVDDTIATVATAVAASTSSAPLRVFTLGIGETVSSAMVEGIANAGNGATLLASTAESIVGKCAQLLRAGRSAALKNVSIDWGSSSSPRSPASRVESTVSFSETPSLGSNGMQLGLPPAVQQSPPAIETIYPGIRSRVFVILSQKYVPEQITLRGQLDGQGEVVQIDVPVMKVSLWDRDHPGLPLVHTLAARGLIKDLDAGEAAAPIAQGDANEADRRKAGIVRLGVRYQLASRYTSFLAVHHGVSGSRSERRDSRHVPALVRNATRRRAEPFVDAFVLDLWSSVLNTFTNILGFVFSDTKNLNTSDRDVKTAPGAWPDIDPQLSSTSVNFESADEEEQWTDSADSFTTMSSLEGSFSSEWTPPPSPPPSPPPRLRVRPPSPVETRSPSPVLESIHNAPSSIRQQRVPQPTTRLDPLSPPKPVPPEVMELVSLQAFDGSFPLDEAVGRIVGPAALHEGDALGVSPTLWATALAVAFLQKHLAHQPDLLSGLLDKTLEFVHGDQSSESEAQFNRLVLHAKGLVS